MSDDEMLDAFDDEKSKNKFWNILGTIFISIIILIIIGIIMYVITLWGANIYSKNYSDFHYTSGWMYSAYLNPFYGSMGIIIYILINCFGFLSYNFIINKLENCKIAISKCLFIVFSVFINFIMCIVVYSRVFGSFLFENTILEHFNEIIIGYGWITFPIIFLIIYIIYENYKKS